MVTLLTAIFIKRPHEYSDPAIRRQYGALCGALGVLLNILLFAGKWTAGLISGSVAISADAFNNLSDAGSSIITLIGFRLSGQKPDPEHPYGHGRMEYISGLMVSFAIILMGFELVQSSIEKILHPQTVETSLLIYAILILSILLKCYMYFYNHRIGCLVDSTAMAATAKDSLSDALGTAGVLLAAFISDRTGLMLDGYLGMLVSLLILRTGISSVKETITPLLGQPPKKEFVDEIEKIVLASPSVLGIHDLLVHDYGPGRCMISLHAEVSAHADLLEIHDEIDNVERALEEQLHCMATIHMDPIITDDQETSDLYHRTKQLVHDIHPDLSIHDFRIVKGNTHTNLIFDVLVPFSVDMTDRQIEGAVNGKVSALTGGTYYAVIHIDHTFTA